MQFDTPTNQAPNQAPPVNQAPPANQGPPANLAPIINQAPPVNQAPPANPAPFTNQAPPVNQAPISNQAAPPAVPAGVSQNVFPTNPNAGYQPEENYVVPVLKKNLIRPQPGKDRFITLA